MIGYVTLGTNNFDQSAKFYDVLLAEVGATRIIEADTFIAWSAESGKTALSIIKPFDQKEATVGNGAMVALEVETPQQVDSLHAKALSLGAMNEGDPGSRGEGFYAGYFRDLDGNKLNFYCTTAI